MTRCLNCLKLCDGMCCSSACYGERMALMLEGVELLDSIMRMVDEAAEKRVGRAPAQPAQAPKPRPIRPEKVQENQPTMPGLLVESSHGTVPNGLDAA